MSTVWALRTRFDTLRERPAAWLTAFALGWVGLAAFAVTVGAVDVPLRDLPRALVDSGHPLHTVLLDVRLPRIVGAGLVGAALACAGTLMQTVVRNPLADPGILGVTAGAGVAVLLVIVLRPAATFSLPFFGFMGAFAAVAVLLMATWASGRTVAPLRILLTGVALQAVGFGVIALVQFFFADRAPAFVAFVVGSLNGLTWRDVGIVLGPTVVGIGLAAISVRALDVLTFDDATAGGVGLAVRRARLAASGISALLAAAAVSVVGLVGFVGLIVPNAVRVALGPEHRTLVPLAAAGGALLMLAADTFGRVAVAPLELPVGALLALIGGPYFMVLLWRKLS